MDKTIPSRSLTIPMQILWPHFRDVSIYFGNNRKKERFKFIIIFFFLLHKCPCPFIYSYDEAKSSIFFYLWLPVHLNQVNHPIRWLSKWSTNEKTLNLHHFPRVHLQRTLEDNLLDSYPPNQMTHNSIWDTEIKINNNNKYLFTQAPVNYRWFLAFWMNKRKFFYFFF